MAFVTTRPAAPLAPGTARLISGDAAVTVRRATPVAAADALLRAGDTVIVETGMAMLKTSVGSLWALGGSSILITDGAPRITKGDVLVHGKGMNVDTRAASAEVNGVARVRQGLTLEIGVYRGGVLLRTMTETLGVPRLRRAIVAGRGGPASVTVAPLIVDATDNWDRKFLGEAIELDAALSSRSRGLTMQIAGGGAALMDQVISRTGWTSLTALRAEPIGELVVAAELARAANLDAEAMAAALQLRAEGASWGLIALEQGVHSVPTPFEGLDAAVVPVLAPAVAVPLAPETKTTPTTTAPTSTRITVPTVPSVPVTQPPVTVPPPAPDKPGSPVAGLVDDLVGGLLGH